MVHLKWFHLLNLRERVDHSSHRGIIAGANVVKVQHALNSTRLHAPNNGLCLFSEECGGFGWGEKVRDIRAACRGKEREEKVGVRLREKGMTVDVNKQIIETEHTLRKKKAGREIKNIAHFWLIYFHNNCF